MGARKEIKKRITVIGGGTGTYTVLSGLKKYPVALSAVISMCDSGGSTGRLRKELNMLPPGDIRRAILALSDLPFASKTLEGVFDFRFANGKSLAGHSVGNILLAALVQITGSMDRAIDEAARIFNLSGDICPVTLDKTNLVAILEDGTRVFGESKIDMRNFKLEYPISKVYLTPKAKIFRKAALAIESSDLIILGPGDLYTSIIPTLLVEGMTQALKRSKGKIVFIVNLVTKRGETDNFAASDFLKAIMPYLGIASDNLNYVVVNKDISMTKNKIANWYKRLSLFSQIYILKRNERLHLLQDSEG
ncbi:MAG: YvcK family protein [Patescibacteria group bacterium]